MVMDVNKNSTGWLQPANTHDMTSVGAEIYLQYTLASRGE
jgi:hypothetical protein